MSDDICERLVRFSKHKQCMSTDLEVEAAAEITRLREEVARLREELQKEFNAMRVFARYRELEAEIETLRGMLREAHVKMEANNLWSNLRHRVAAAIRDGGKDE